MKKRSLVMLPASEPAGASQTGHYCLQSGWWIASVDPIEARFITKGDVMPALNGGPTLWRLSTEADAQNFGLEGSSR